MEFLKTSLGTEGTRLIETKVGLKLQLQFLGGVSEVELRWQTHICETVTFLSY